VLASPQPRQEIVCTSSYIPEMSAMSSERAVIDGTGIDPVARGERRNVVIERGPQQPIATRRLHRKRRTKSEPWV
jgi:hypothetical protein